MIRLLAILLAAGVTMSPATASASKPLPLVDLTDDFAAVWDQTASLEEPARVAAVKGRFDKVLPGFYSGERLGMTEAAYDARLAKGIASFSGQRAGIEDVSHRFAAMLEPARTSFEAAFGPLGDLPDIYLVNSLGEMDGGTRMLGGVSHLVFGADMIARLHGDHKIQPFFHHELFHVYHQSRFEGCEETWCGLWTEGLATAVAANLNPGSTDAELLLTVPEPLHAAYDAHRDEAVCLVRARLDMPANEAGLFFGSKRPSDSLPPRIGYYVGYLLAAKAAESRSMKELAEMKMSEVRPLVEKTLAAMASCPA